MTGVGDVVVCRALDSRPHMLVVETAADALRTVLLAELAEESVQRLCHGEVSTVLTAISRADDIETYRVPREDVVPEPICGGEC